jgi:hypothetical protein
MTGFVVPGSAAASMTRARNASACAVFWRRVQPTSTARSASERVIELAKGRAIAPSRMGARPGPHYPRQEYQRFTDSHY